VNRHLYRSPDDRILAGVAGGMAQSYDLDPALVRVGWALLILVSGGIFLVLYLVMALVVPLRPVGMSLWATAAPGDPQPMGTAPDGPPSTPPMGPGAYGPDGYRHYRRHDGSGALIFGVILIVAGGFFFARQFIPALNVALFWPLIAIAGGILLIIFAFGRDRSVR
jgi:phage shock protein C